MVGSCQECTRMGASCQERTRIVVSCQESVRSLLGQLGRLGKLKSCQDRQEASRILVLNNLLILTLYLIKYNLNHLNIYPTKNSYIYATWSITIDNFAPLY